MSALREALRNLPDAVFADLLESESAYLIVVDIPGATSETVDINLERSIVRIEARDDKAVPSEFDFIEEQRPAFTDLKIPVPPDATANEATARIERGVLELKLPKQTANPEVEIPVEDG